MAPGEKLKSCGFFSILFSWQPKNSKICSQILSRMMSMADGGHLMSKITRSLQLRHSVPSHNFELLLQGVLHTFGTEGEYIGDLSHQYKFLD